MSSTPIQSLTETEKDIFTMLARVPDRTALIKALGELTVKINLLKKERSELGMPLSKGGSEIIRVLRKACTDPEHRQSAREIISGILEVCFLSGSHKDQSLALGYLNRLAVDDKALCFNELYYFSFSLADEEKTVEKGSAVYEDSDKSSSLSKLFRDSDRPDSRVSSTDLLPSSPKSDERAKVAEESPVEPKRDADSDDIDAEVRGSTRKEVNAVTAFTTAGLSSAFKLWVRKPDTPSSPPL